MIAIVYASRATAHMDEAALVELLTVSRGWNERQGVTGMLLYAYESFVQVIEGEADVVDETYGRIVRDARHTDIRLLARRPINRRSYADWTMGFEHPGGESGGQRLPGYNRALQYPLVSSDLVSNAEVAEHLLALLASQHVVQAGPR